ncbi:hypothetical protein [Streptomyces sp. NPDC002520]
MLLAIPLTLAGPLSLVLPVDAPQPRQQVVAIEATMASTSVFFTDPEVQRMLLRHGIRMDIHHLGCTASPPKV